MNEILKFCYKFYQILIKSIEKQKNRQKVVTRGDKEKIFASFRLFNKDAHSKLVPRDLEICCRTIYLINN